jgi:hypothetical protein
MPHTVLIALHAVAGVVALCAGGFAIRDGRFFDVYLGALAGTVVFLAAAVTVSWRDTDTGARLLFAAFTALALAMLARAVLARRGRPGTHPYVEHVGFTLVALFDAFVVIAVLDLGAPVWLVVTTGIAIAVAGHFVLRGLHRVLVPAASSTGHPTSATR